MRRAGHALLGADRQAGEPRQLRPRPAEQRLGLEDQAVAHRDMGVAAGLGGVDGQVAARVPGSDDEDALTL